MRARCCVLRGKGLPDVNGYGHGDILVVVDITIPDTLTAEERELVQKLSTQPHFKTAARQRQAEYIRAHEEFFQIA